MELKEAIVIDVYPMDLGNGFSKRVVNSECVVEASVYADVESYFSDESNVTKLELKKDDSYFVGDDVQALGLKPNYALGENDLDRYDTDEFEKILFGFIAKDFQSDVVINRLVTGLPVQHYKAKAKTLEELMKGKKVVKINDKDIMVDVKEVSVIPQPIGTYLYAVSTKKVTPNKDLTLVVDCGHGTLDVTELKGKTIVKRAGNNEGVKEAYIEIYNTLSEEYGSLKTLTISNVPNLLKSGLTLGGANISIIKKKEVQAILKKHFNSIFTFLQDNKFDLRAYDKVIFTGGVVHLYKDFFDAREDKNFEVLEDGQTANVRGYNEFGKALAK